MDSQTQIAIGATALIAILGLLATIFTNRRYIYAFIAACVIIGIWGLLPLFNTKSLEPLKNPQARIIIENSNISHNLAGGIITSPDTSLTIKGTTVDHNGGAGISQSH